MILLGILILISVSLSDKRNPETKNKKILLMCLITVSNLLSLKARSLEFFILTPIFDN